MWTQINDVASVGNSFCNGCNQMLISLRMNNDLLYIFGVYYVIKLKYLILFA